MTSHRTSLPLPLAALREFTRTSQADWQDGVPLTELLTRVNRVAAGLMGSDDQTRTVEGRVSRTFTERSFRHYQTLGCIDVPEKHGRPARYGFRHFLQALLVRKLLWQRLSSEQITAMLVGRTTDDLEQMLVGGVELVARYGGDDGKQPASTLSPAETWNRVRIAPGVELQLNANLPRFKPAELKRLTELIGMTLRKHRS